MSKAIERSELPQRIDSVVDDVVREHVPYIVSHNGDPAAAVIPYADFLRYESGRQTESRRVTTQALHHAGVAWCGVRSWEPRAYSRL